MQPAFAPETRDSRRQILAVVALALFVRMVLAPRYFGWEEGDYGNLMMIREVIDSHFTWFRTAHMPGWYILGAAGRLLAGGADRLPPLLITMSFSVGSVAIATALARRVVGAGSAWLVGVWLAVQPEMALFGASTLRSPVYAALGIAGLWMSLRGSRNGVLATAAAFLVRMEAFFVFFLPALLTWGPARGRPISRLFPALLVLSSVVGSWQLYIALAQGEVGPFWAGPFEQNQAGDVITAEFVKNGFASVWTLATWTLPRKVSWTCLALAGIGGLAVLRGFGRSGARPVLGYMVFTLGFWFAEGFISQQDPNHNLYWVWLLPAIPPLILLASIGWGWLDERMVALPRTLRCLVLTLVALSAAPSFLTETRYQMERSEAWYRPQLELAKWLEAHARPDAGMVLGSIPEVWVQRKEHPFRVTAWWFLPRSLKGAQKAELGAFLADQRVDYLMWFAEEWTEAPAIAPYLAAGQAIDAGDVRLIPIDREDGYGWILYVVERPGAEPPPRPPAFGSGARGTGWGA